MVGHRQLRSLPGWIGATNATGREVVKAAAKFRHGGIHGEQILRSHRTQRDHDLGFDHRNLPHQKRGAGFTLVALRCAIAGRPAFHNVRDVDIFAADAHGLDHIVEQLARTAHERFALRIFVGAGTFAHKH